MNSIKAILTGVAFIIIAILLMQLAYLITIVGINNLAKDYPSLNKLNGNIGTIIITTILLAIMFTGGYITALIAEKKVLLHCLTIGLITTGGMMWMALENSQLTPMGIFINTLLLIFTLLGGLYQIKNLAKQQEQK